MYSLMNRLSHWPTSGLDFGRLFEEVADDLLSPSLVGRPAFPALNIREDENTFYLEAELPGLSMEDIELNIQGDELTLKGCRKWKKQENSVVHCRERGYGEFTRTVMLPVEVDADKAKATLKDGVLNIVLPKSERARGRKIEVQAG